MAKALTGLEKLLLLVVGLPQVLVAVVAEVLGTL